jgi:ABC-type antimicrobial peptide transport system permease subunit
MGYARAWNGEYVGDEAGRELSAVVAILKEGARSTELIAYARARGYDIADSGAEQAGLAITLMTLLFALVSLAILLVAAMNIAHGFFRAVAERRRELGLLRALGATERDLGALLLTEAAALGLIGGATGVVLARVAGLTIDLAASRFVPDFPFKPESFFSFDASVIAIGLGASLVACLLGAILPARLAARVDPAAALQGG